MVKPPTDPLVNILIIFRQKNKWKKKNPLQANDILARLIDPTV